MLCVDNFFTGARHHIEHLLDHKRFELLRHDITHPLFVEVDEIFNLACPASPIHYQKDPVQTTKTSVIGSINMLGLAKRLKIKILQASTSEDLRRPRRCIRNRNLLGACQPDRSALLLRRGQALRRDFVLRLLAPTSPADKGRPHLQHLRTADPPQRRARGVELHRAGAAQSGHHHIWRRPTDAVILLCRRFDPWSDSHDGNRA